MPSIRAIAAGTSPIEKPNLESAWPVEIFSCVSPRTSGVTRIKTFWGTPPPATAAIERSRRSSSSKLSTTIKPTRASSAIVSSDSDFALPWKTIRSAEKPAFNASQSSPPEATSHQRPSCANSSSTAVQGNAFEANTTLKSACAASAPACTNARARARRSSSATT